MKHRVFSPINNSRLNIVRAFTVEMYGYVLTDDTYSKLLRSRSSVFDKLLCEYTNKKFFSVKTNERNGVLNFMSILQLMDEFGMVEFNVDDIVRSGLIKSYLINKLNLGF